MKRIALAILMASTLALPATSLAQKHRHTPRTETTTTADSTTTAPTDTMGIEAFSDTTYVDTTDNASSPGATSIDWDDIDDDDLSLRDLGDLLGLGVGTGAAAIIALVVLCIIAVFPFLIIALVIWLLIRSRNRRYRLAEKAMESGQPIPNELIEPERSDMWQKGIRNIFLGIGLAVFFYCLDFEGLAGIGWLVAICGAGQAFIGKTSGRNKRNEIDKY
ncbi:MAG: hypothetical protein IIZ97_01075 [Prevotella sp.]|nr:hypothetical protein [Prevotella sp.]